MSDDPRYAHQSVCLTAMCDHSSFALLMEMGTGKTRVLLEDWRRMVDARLSRDLLVVAPAGVYRVWEGEVARWIPDLDARILTWKSSATKAEKSRLQAALADDYPGPRVLLINVEALSSVDAAIDTCKRFLRRGGATIAVDESTTIKNSKAARTKRMFALGQLAQYRRIMSGLPTPRSPLDLYSQFWFLDPRILGFRSYYAFRARYAVMRKVHVHGPTKRPIDMVVGYRNVEELWKKIASHSYRITKDECLDLPPKIYQMREVALTDEQRRHYDSIRKTAMAMLDDGTLITTELAVTTLLRLHQITSGFLTDEFGKHHDVASHRVDDLVSLLDEHSGKAIVWAPYRHSLASIIARLADEYGERSVVSYWGDTKADARVEAVERFQSDPECRFFVGNPSTGGRGLTLTAASLVVYFANSWDLEHRAQSEDRAHRAGLQHSVTYVDMVAPGTIDERIVKVLRQKIDMASLVTGEKLREWLV